MKSKPTLIIIFFAVIIIICYSGYSFYNYVLQSEKNQAYTNISHTARLKISQIINWKNERMSDASFIQHNTSINRLIFNFLNDPGNNLLKQEIIDWIKELKENHEYVDIILITRHYKSYSLFERNYQPDSTDINLLNSSFEEKKIKFGIFYRSSNTGKVYTSIFIPLSLNNEIFGFIKIKIDPKENLYPLIETVPVESKTAETFIVRLDGDSITHLHDLRFKKNTALTFKLPLSLENLPSAMAARGITGIVEGTDYNGNKVLADLNKIEGTNWFIVSKIGMNEVYAPVRRQALFIIFGVVALIAILGLAINILWKNQKVQYLHSQLGLEKELQKSREQFKSVVETAMDGVITVDENQRITLFNKASEKIFGIPAEEAIGMSLEKFIPERFHEAHRQDIRQFAKESPETRYMGKERVITGRLASGEEIIMEASISHFRIDGKQYYTVIHRDVTSRKKMEEALYQSELRFRSLVNATTDVLYLMNPDWSEMLHLSSGGFLASTEKPEKDWLQKYIHTEDQEYVLSAINEAIKKKKIFELEHRVKLNDGSWGWTFSRAIPIIDKKGDVIEWFGAAADFTERKIAVKELKESEERFSAAFGSNPNALVISRVDDGRIVEVNETFTNLFQYSRDEVIGKTSIDLGMFDNPEDRTTAIGLLSANGFLNEFEITIRLRDGEKRTALLSAVALKTSQRQAFLTIIQDVTDKKIAEMALLESEKRFRELAEAMPQVVWTAKADGSVDYYNKQVNELEGITLTEGGLWEWTPVVHEDDIQKTVEAWQNAVNTGSVYEVIHRIKKKEGGYKWFLSRAVPTKNEHGEILRWYGTSTDISFQKEAEEKLKLSESRFRDLIETQQEMIIRINPAGQFTFVNDAFCRKFGVNKNEFTGNSFVPFVYPDDLPLAFEKIREMEHPPYRASIEIREYTAEGLCWIEWNGTGITDSDGKIIEFQAVGRDITGLKNAEEELRERERQFRTLAENSPEVIARFDRDLRHTFVNKYGSIVYGVPQEEIIGKTSAELGMPADKVDFWNAYFEEVLRTGKQQIIEFDFNSPNLGHQYFSSLFVPEFNEHGEVDSILAITRDISERKNLEKKLRESEQRIKNKLDSIISPEGDISKLELAEIIDTTMIQTLMDNFYKVANIPMSIVDLKGNILVGVGWQKICTEFHRVNPESHKYCLESDLELSKGVLPGEFKLYKCKNNMWDLSSPIMIGGNHVGNLFIGQFYFDKDVIDYATFREQARKYGFDEDEYISALEAVPRLSEETLAAGLEFFIKLSNMISKLSFSNIQLARLVAERDNLLNSLRIFQDDLKRSNKDLEQFAYISSHDLQEPIRMISSYAQLIKLKNIDKLESATIEFLGFIIEGAARMQQLVDDLLKYSRISTTKPEFENVDCNILLGNILSDLRLRIEEENAVINIDELPEVKGNATQLRQLFQNFIINALKFRREERPEIKISCEMKDGKWLFSIKDNGIGIEEQYYERIFIIFQRLHDRDKYPGSGIGLALCKKIVERHGGQVCVESEPGKGTIFYFTLAA